MKTVLIISYYWPPAGGPGSQRVVKFVKYLPQLGWQPVVLTVDKGEFPYLDATLQENISSQVKVYRTNWWAPFSIYKKVTHKNIDEELPVGLLTLRKNGVIEKFAAWIRANIFIPDARIGWFPFAIYQGLKIIEQEKVDLIFSSSPPHSSQFIGLYLKLITQLPWISDLRDPWTKIRYYQVAHRLSCTQKLDAFFEKKVINKADRIITVSKSLADDFGKKICCRENHVHVIPNGYDPDDFNSLLYDRDKYFRIVYCGNMLANQNPDVLWKSLLELFCIFPAMKSIIRVVMIGRIHNDVIEFIREKNLIDSVEIRDFIPHKQVLKEIKNASLLFMVIPRVENNKGIVTGKLFEYIGSGRPILVIGPPESDAGQIIVPFKQSKICDYQDEVNCVDFVRRTFEEWLNNNDLESDPQLRAPYSRSVLTQRLAAIFDSVIKVNN